LSNIETLVTDDDIPEAAIELCRQHEVELEIVAQQPSNQQSAGAR
jgi:DeoR/GlpR family transcriptional regulator of sugar metabolism